jgi:hypothetical protein
MHAGVAAIDLNIPQDNDFVFEEVYMDDFAT